jgi:hypothetical protein
MCKYLYKFSVAETVFLMCKHYSNFFHLFFLYRQEMEDKQYRVPIHLTEQLKQITGISIRRNIQAQNRMISIIPFPCMPNGLQRFPLPQQNFDPCG